MAYGNQETCEAVAFTLHIGLIASIPYTLALCIYYLHVIRYNARDHDFAKRIESWLHRICIAYPLLGAIVNLAPGNLNSNGITCWIASKPPFCAVGECTRGANSLIYGRIFAGIPCAVAFVGIVYVMVVISWTVIKQERRNARFRFQQTTDGNHNTCLSFCRHLRSSIGNRFSRGKREAGDSNNVQQLVQPIGTYATRGVRASQNRVRVALTQSLLYIGAFAITYTGWFAIVMYTVKLAPIPFPLLAEHFTIYPLCGFFNILVYTRPKVSTIRRRRPEYWWFQAFLWL